MARLRRGVAGTLVLDAEGLSKLALGDPRVRSKASAAYRREAEVVTAASTLTEILRGGPRDAPFHRALGKVTVASLDGKAGRRAGELLGTTRLSGHRCALDALLAVVALAQPRPVVLLTSDPRDLKRLTEEPSRPKAERIVVVRV